MKRILDLFKVKRTFGRNQEEIPVPVSMTDEQVKDLRKKIELWKSIRGFLNENKEGATIPIKLCIDHVYSGDYEGKTVVITSPDHCSVCNDSPTWTDIAYMFRAANVRLTELGLYMCDEECLSETNDQVKAAFVAYFRKVHPDVLEEFLKTALEKIK